METIPSNNVDTGSYIKPNLNLNASEFIITNFQNDSASLDNAFFTHRKNEFVFKERSLNTRYDASKNITGKRKDFSAHISNSSESLSIKPDNGMSPTPDTSHLQSFASQSQVPLIEDSNMTVFNPCGYGFPLGMLENIQSDKKYTFRIQEESNTGKFLKKQNIPMDANNPTLGNLLDSLPQNAFDTVRNVEITEQGLMRDKNTPSFMQPKPTSIFSLDGGKNISYNIPREMKSFNEKNRETKSFDEKNRETKSFDEINREMKSFDDENQSEIRNTTRGNNSELKNNSIEINSCYAAQTVSKQNTPVLHNVNIKNSLDNSTEVCGYPFPLEYGNINVATTVEKCLSPNVQRKEFNDNTYSIKSVIEEYVSDIPIFRTKSENNSLSGKVQTMLNDDTSVLLNTIIVNSDKNAIKLCVDPFSYLNGMNAITTDEKYFSSNIKGKECIDETLTIGCVRSENALYAPSTISTEINPLSLSSKAQTTLRNNECILAKNMKIENSKENCTELNGNSLSYVNRSMNTVTGVDEYFGANIQRKDIGDDKCSTGSNNKESTLHLTRNHSEVCFTSLAETTASQMMPIAGNVKVECFDDPTRNFVAKRSLELDESTESVDRRRKIFACDLRKVEFFKSSSVGNITWKNTPGVSKMNISSSESLLPSSAVPILSQKFPGQGSVRYEVSAIYTEQSFDKRNTELLRNIDVKVKNTVLNLNARKNEFCEGKRAGNLTLKEENETRGLTFKEEREARSLTLKGENKGSLTLKEENKESLTFKEQSEARSLRLKEKNKERCLALKEGNKGSLILKEDNIESLTLKEDNVGSLILKEDNVGSLILKEDNVGSLALKEEIKAIILIVNKDNIGGHLKLEKINEARSLSSEGGTKPRSSALREENKEREEIAAAKTIERNQISLEENFHSTFEENRQMHLTLQQIYKYDNSNMQNSSEENEKSKNESRYAAYAAKNESLKCHICSLILNSTSVLKWHEKHCSKPAMLLYGECRICGFKPSKPSRKAIKSHLLIHSNQRPYKCEDCGKGFISGYGLKSHRLTHSNKYPFKCTVCGKPFKDGAKANFHMRRHQPELCNRNIPCDVCGKKFFNNDGLRKHYRMHTGEKPYSCHVCNKSYRIKSNLIYHLNYHTKERPYLCNFCGKSFGSKTYLSTHKKMHEKSNNFKCKICGKLFNFSTNLNQHLKTHGDKRDHACRLCDKKFKLPHHLRQHEQTHL